ncbi:beta strand repeat-containing protein [Marinicella sp. W31]|uniref:beta strand repeat-containing protein n=1 Tax=Marinicella sp. W31 TaxID=3023713 RepID=UPI0037566EC4
MKHIVNSAFLFIFLVLSQAAIGQDRFYHVYFDIDNNPASGCSIALPDFTTNIEGVESRLTITTDSNQPPNITATRLHLCNGTAFDAGTATSPAALGLNTGTGGADVFEAAINQTSIGVTSSGTVRFYFNTDSDTAADIVLTNVNGGPIILGFVFPIPTLGLLALCLLALFVVFIARRQLSTKLNLMIVLLAVSSAAWAMIIIIDGQTGDWAGVNAIGIDPSGDTSVPGSFADINEVYISNNDNTLSFRIDVVDVENQAPVANAGNDTTLEDNAITLTVTGSDAEGAPVTFSQATAPANGTLGAFTVVNATSSTVQYTPNADFNGVDSFTFVSNDGQVSSAAAAFDITVTAVNDAPSFTSGGDVNQLKTAGPYNQAWATNISAGAANENAQNLTFNITANDNAALFTAQPAIDANGTLTFEGVANATGTANITVTLSDDAGTANGGADTSAAVNFAITLQGVNDEPSFTAGGDETILEDAGAQTVAAWATAISAGPPNESTQTLTFNVTGNTNPTLFSVAPAIDAVTGNLTYTTAADANGSADITVELMDNGGTANGGDDTSAPATFNITVTAVNDAPTFTDGGNINVLEDSGAFSQAWATAISPGPADEAAQTTTFNVNNDNNALFSVQPALDTAGNLSFTVNNNTTGTANVTVTLSDNGGTANGGADTSAAVNFQISVTTINDEPSFTAGPDQSILEDAGAQTVAAWATNILAGPPDENAQVLTFNVTGNTNAALFAAGPTVNPTTGDLTYTPAAGANGSADITIELMDNGGTANGGDDTSASATFNISVTAVNDAPSFTPGADETVVEDSGVQTVNGWATGISAGPADEAGQTLTFNITGNTNPGLFSAGPAIDNSGNLTYTPVANLGGAATITIELMDNGGTANGGVDTSAPVNFDINVTGINDAPSFTAGPATVAVNEDSAAQNAAWATTISAGPADEAGQALNFVISQTSIDSTLSFTTPPAISPTTGNLSYTAAANAYGSAVYTVQLMDNGGTANGGVDTSATVPLTITINPLNDAPSASALAPFAAATNIEISIAAANGLLNGITDEATEAADPNGPASPGTNLTVGNGGNPAPTTTTNGGDLSINTTTGAFTYNPPPGFTGADTFDVVVCDDGIGLPASACSAAITVTINVSGNTVWFIDAAAAAGGDGRLTSPFQSIAEYNASTDPAAGDFIYLANNATPYNGTVTLLNNQTLFGEGTTGSTFDAFTGITPPAGSATRPTLGGTRPVLASGGAAVQPALNNTLRGFNIGNTGGSGINAQVPFGTLTIREFSILGTGRAANLNAVGTLDAQLNTLESSGALNGFISGAVGGSLTVSGNTSITNTGGAAIFVGTPPAGTNFNFGTTTITNSAADGINTNGTNATAVFTFNNPVITSTGIGLRMDGGQLNITGAAGNVTSSANAAFDLDNVTVNGTLAQTNATNTNGSGIQLDNISGTANFGAGTLSITGTGNAFDVGANGNGSGGNAVVTYSGTIQSTGSGRSVLIQELAGGSITLNGNITDTSSGLRIRGINNGTAATVNFNGTVTANTGANIAVDLGSTGGNTNGTINFTNTLDIDTTSARGFNAQNGGLISVTGTGNTVNTTAGRAINISDTNIAATNVTFQQVSAGGSADLGINLVNTGATGGFRITGVGTTAGSGGTIANKTGPDNSTIAGSGIFMNNTSNVQLALMQLNDFQNYAIRGTNVNGFSLIDSVISGTNGTTPFIDDEAAIRFDNLSGISILSGNDIAGGIEDQVRIINTTGTLDLTVNDSSNNQAIIGLDHTPAGFSGNDGILLQTSTNATATLLIDGVTFTGARGDNVQTNALNTSTQNVTIRNNTFTNTHPNIVAGGGGVTLSGSGTGAGINITYSVTGNTFNNANGNSLTSNFVSGAGAVSGTLANNLVGTLGGTSGSAAGSGISVGSAGTIGHNSTVNNNTVAGIAGFTGLDFAHDGNGAFNSNVTNNNVSGLSGFALSAMNSTLAGGGIATGTACLDIENNSLDASGAAFGLNAIFLDELNAAATYNLPGFGGSPNGEFAFSCAPGNASTDGHGLLLGQGNTFVNGAFPSFPGIMLDASLVCGKTGVGTSCP